jgi:hypothetical protein
LDSAWKVGSCCAVAGPKTSQNIMICKLALKVFIRGTQRKHNPTELADSRPYCLSRERYGM